VVGLVDADSWNRRRPTCAKANNGEDFTFRLSSFDAAVGKTFISAAAAAAAFSYCRVPNDTDVELGGVDP